MGRWEKNLKSNFAGFTCSQGEYLYERERVEVVAFKPGDFVLVEVQYRNTTYDVYVELRWPDDPEWGNFADACFHCSCSDFANNMHCEHAWAAVLSIDTDLGDRVFGTRRRPKRLYFEYASELKKHEGFFASEEEGRFQSRISPGWFAYLRSRYSVGSGGKQPDWHLFFRSLPAVEPVSSPMAAMQAGAIEPIYIIEAGMSRTNPGRLVITLNQPGASKGQSGKLRRFELSSKQLRQIREGLDRKICMNLLGAQGLEGPSRFSTILDENSYNCFSKWSIRDYEIRELLPMMAETGRLYFREHGREKPVPVIYDPVTWELVFLIKPEAEGDKHVLQAVFRHGEDIIGIRDCEELVPSEPALVYWKGTVSPIETYGCEKWVPHLQELDSIPISEADMPGLMDELQQRGVMPPIEWPSDWGITIDNKIDPVPELTLRLNNDNWDRFPAARAEVGFRYGESTVGIQNPGQLIYDRSTNHVVRRNPQKEQAFMSALLEHDGRFDTFGDLEIPTKNLPELIARLVDEGWQVRGNKSLYRGPGTVKIDVSTGIDWFDVKGVVTFGDVSIGLPKLLAAVRKGEKFIKLGDGSFGMLPQEWLDRHLGWFELGEAQDEFIRFQKSQIGLLDALLAEMPEATFDEQLGQAREQLHAFEGIEPIQEIEDFRGTLREYQRDGLGWMKFLDDFSWGGCLADDMGLGKTVQVLALLASEKKNRDNARTLIVVPKSVVFNWTREAERFDPELRVLNYTGPKRGELFDQIAEHDITLTTYGTLRRDILELKEIEFNYAILDEAQAIKNPASQRAKACRLINARRKLVLTGTPIENHLGDLWSIFEFLNPGMLGTVNAFQGLIGNGAPGENGNNNMGQLQRAVRPFILRRTKSQVAPELPERSEQTIECELSGRQLEYYTQLREHYRTTLLSRIDKDGMNKNKMHVLEALLRLRQAACHPGLIDKERREEESAKLEILHSMVTELIEEGHKALIFSQFTSMLAIVKDSFDKSGLTYEYLDGKTRDRAERVDRFQSDEDCRLFLISLKAGGLGLNLTAADYVFILDPWWNPAVEAQAIDRTHRIGQDKKVIAYRLIARDTVEEKIVQLQDSKKELADAIITRKNSLIKDLSKDDLAMLLS